MRILPFLRRFPSCCLLGVILPSAVALGQSSIRCWGENGYDTDGRHRTFVQVDASFYQTAVLRADGRVFVNGQNWGGALVVPSLPAGLTYTAMGITPAGGGALRSDGSIVTWSINTQVLGMPSYFPPTPPLPPGMHYTQIAVSGHILALCQATPTLRAKATPRSTRASRT